MEDKTILKKEEIINELKSLNNWIYRNKALEKTFQFFKFKDLINLLKKTMEIMDFQNHHSDLRLDTKNKIIKISVTTHSENAVTRADINFVKELENEFQRNNNQKNRKKRK